MKIQPFMRKKYNRPMDPENGIPNILPLEPGSGFRNPTYPPSWRVSKLPGPKNPPDFNARNGTYTYPRKEKKGNIHKPTNFWEIQPLVDSGMFFLKTRDEAVCCYTLENEHGKWTSPIWKGTKTSELLNQTFTILFQPFIFRGMW